MEPSILITGILSALASLLTLCCVQLKISKIKQLRLGPLHIDQRSNKTSEHGGGELTPSVEPMAREAIATRT